MKLKTSLRVCQFILIGFFFTASNLFAQVQPMPVFTLEKNISTYKNSLKKYFKTFETAKFPAKALSNFLQQNHDRPSVFKLAITDSFITLHLQPSQIVSNEYELTIQDEHGLQKQRVLLENIFYKGYANDDQNNIVRLTIKEGLVNGFIKINGKEIFIQSAADYVQQLEQNDVVIYQAADVIGNDLPCGFTASKKMIETAIQQSDSTIFNRPQAGECKKLKFVFLTDYSMFTYFNGDITLMQNKMLAVLNTAQGVYTGLNFNSNPIDDVGTDELQFEIVQFHAVSCSKCDITSEGQTPFVLEENLKVTNWINSNTDTTALKAVYYWTNRLLIDPSISNANYAGYAYQLFGSCNTNKVAFLLCRYQENVGYLRDVSAHELGHAFGCLHDDLINPSVTSFIMNSITNVNATALSSIANFTGQISNGFLYSSKAVVKRKIAALTNCFGNCDSIPICEDVVGLSVSKNTDSDSAVFTWSGNSNMYNVRVKENTNAPSATLININTNQKRFVVKGLAKCRFYTLEVINTCGKKSSISFSNSTFNVNKPLITHVRSSLHDVELNIQGSNISQGYLRVTIDHTEKWNTAISYPGKVVLKDVFSDGATHRIDIYADNNSCKETVFYKAPYFRNNAISFVNENFNGCAKPSNWKDSIWRMPANTQVSYTPFWNYGSTTKGNVRVIQPGSIDSTCMIYFFDGGIPNRGVSLGSIDITTPVVNVTDYQNIYLSFDYKYFLRPYSVRQPFFKVQCFNGQDWKTIYDAPTTVNNRNIDSTRFWDTIPSRMFIKLDDFSNANLKVRFVVEDSAFVAPGQIKTNSMFVALDNVRIDGYLKTANTKKYDVKIFPNPVNDELFIRHDSQSAQPNRFRIIDQQGKVIRQSVVNNDRINVAFLSPAIYFIQFYFKDNTISNTYKFYKF